METDHTKLESLNVEIGEAESKGNGGFFERHLAPAFAMRRAKPGVYDTRQAFIDKVAESPERTTDIESITVYGNRAFVVCTVTMDGNRFSNLRLFTRDAPDGEWQLLAWANEPA
jgi:hypothetical protein